MTFWRQGWTLVRFIFIFYFVRLPLCNNYSDYCDIYLYTLYYYMCCLLGPYMRCSRLCPLNPGVTPLWASQLPSPSKADEGRDGLRVPFINTVDKLRDGCLVGKQRRTPFPVEGMYHATKPLELVHSDVCGPITPPTPGGKLSFLLLVDDISR